MGSERQVGVAVPASWATPPAYTRPMHLDPFEGPSSQVLTATGSVGVLDDPGRAVAAHRLLALSVGSAALQSLADVAAELLAVDHAEVALLAEQRVVVAASGRWRPSGRGQLTPLQDSVCGVTAELGMLTAIADARTDARVADLPLVASGDIVRYLGVPLVVGEHLVGVLCAYDAEPRQWTDAEVSVLSRLAGSVEQELELRQVSAELADGAARLDLSLGAASIGCFALDPATGALVWDRRLIELFGYEAAAFVPHLDSFTARVQPQDRDRLASAIERAVQTREDLAVEYRITLPGGETRWMTTRGRVVPADDGVRLVGAAFDSTEVRLGRDSVARVLETMTDAFFSLDDGWRFTYVNAKAEELLGRPREQLLGREVWTEFPDAVDSEFYRQYHRAMSSGESVTFHEYYPEPIDRWFEVRAWPSPDSLNVYFQDITARRLVEQEREKAFAETELARNRLALLAEMTRALVSTLDVNEAMARLARIVVPRLADWASVALLDEVGNLQHAVARHADQTLSEQIRRLPALQGSVLTDESYARRVARTGQPVLHERISVDELVAGWDSEELTSLLREIGLASLMIVPLQARDRTLGVLVLAGNEDREPYTDADLTTATEVGQRAGLAIDNAQLYSQQRTAVESLQRHLLPALPAPDFLELVARYRPAAQAAQVGGDFYWGALQEDGATLGAIGDVSGHDLAATSWQAQLAPLLRGFAFEGSREGPASILTRVDRAMRGLQINTMASVVLARIEQTDEDRVALPGGMRRLRWSNAGHPPPMLLRADGRVEVLDSEPDLLLGLDPATERADHVVPLAPGDTVLLYTDGLIERRDSALDTGLTRLRQTMAALGGLPLGQLCDELLARMLPAADPEDDIALLAIRTRPEDEPRPPEASPNQAPPGFD